MEKFKQPTYDEVFTFDHLYKSYKLCCKGVGWKSSTHRYKSNDLFYLNKTYKELKKRKFKSRGFYEFDIVERGKPRHIKSVHISERVVQRCLCDYALVPILSRTFIYDNGACMKYKGIDFALNRMSVHLQTYYRKHGENGYALLFDFSKYFDNINHDRLIEMLNEKIEDKEILNLTTSLVSDFEGDKGLGLGSQISQVCALFYPNKLDHYIKERLHIKHYIRYMDDGCLIHESKDYLKHCLNEIERICDELGIILNRKKTQIVKLSRGINFLKTHFVFGENGKILRFPNKKSIVKMRRKLKKFNKWLTEGRFTKKDIETSYASWCGHMRKFKANRSMQGLNALFNDLFPKETQNEKGLLNGREG